VTVLRNVSERMGEEGMVSPRLPFLSTKPGLIRVLLFQPKGVIVATETAVGVRDRPLLCTQMKAFFNRSRELNVDLAACPEYACPWEALSEAIAEGVTPVEGKLWAIACESISIGDLRARADALAAHCRVVIDRPPAGANGEFLDCLSYLFVARDEMSAQVLTILVQFKTCQMGGDTYESEHLILGDTIYRFGEAGENRLVSLLCSDSLSQSFMDDVVPELRHNTLVLHLQLNPHGDSARFRAYREACCYEIPRNTEVLCLNWAKGTQLENGTRDDDLVIEPRTILFRSTDDLETGDDRVVTNHKQGCYLTYWEQYKSAAYVFSPDPQLFALKMSKPMMIGAGALARRVGIIMDGRYEWMNDDWIPAEGDARDRFEDYWLGQAPQLRPYLEHLSEKPLDAERLIQLCTGRGLGDRLDDWKTLPSFRLDTDDTARRLRLCWSTEGQGYRFRADCLRDFRGFVAVVMSPPAFSARLTPFKEQAFTVDYRSAPHFLHHRNLHINGGPSATAVFLGSTPDRATLTLTKTKLLKRIADVGQDQELIAIWYRDDMGELKDHMDHQVPEISDDPVRNPVGIDETTI
jgi:hypothetical protein